MAHHRLGKANQARACFDRAVRWMREHSEVVEKKAQEMAGFRAVAVLAGAPDDLPDDVFAGPR
jgi:hypothetical protein